jgi:hypothetical protein
VIYNFKWNKFSFCPSFQIPLYIELENLETNTI